MATPHDTWEKIAAFADGELDGEQCCELLREAMADPDRAKCVEHQQQLRKLLAGCMDCQKTMRCPDELKGCIEALATQHCTDRGMTGTAATPAPPPREPAVASNASVLGRVGAWLPLAAAAALLLAAMVFVYTDRAMDAPPPGGANPPITSNDGPLPTRLVASLESRHVRCSTGVSNLEAADEFPTRVDALDTALVEQLGPSLAGLPVDLSSVGYDYRVAGKCTVPGRGAVHIIYAGHGDDATGRQPMMSLWIKPYDPVSDPHLEPGQAHLATDAWAAHPIRVWRDDEMIYYLVGDAPAGVERAQQILALRS